MTGGQDRRGAGEEIHPKVGQVIKLILKIIDDRDNILISHENYPCK